VGQYVVQDWETHLAPAAGAAARWGFVSSVVAATAAVPVAAWWIARRRRTGDAVGGEGRAAAAWVPLLAGGYAIFQIDFIPGVDRVLLSLGVLLRRAASDPSLTVTLGTFLQMLFLAAGLVLSMAVFWKTIDRDGSGKPVGGRRPGLALHPAGMWVYAVAIGVLTLRPGWLLGWMKRF
jgi:hypothetical protein